MNAIPAGGVIAAFFLAIVLAAALGFLLGRALTRARYVEAYERITGRDLADWPHPEA